MTEGKTCGDCKLCQLWMYNMVLFMLVLHEWTYDHVFKCEYQTLLCDNKVAHYILKALHREMQSATFHVHFS